MDLFNRLVYFLFFAVSCQAICAQNKTIDVLHYHFEISLQDSNNIITGNAGISFIAKQRASRVYFDLTNRNDSNGRGMKVLMVYEDHQPLQFNQDGQHVTIFFDDPLKLNEQREIHIKYAGIPADGLIISENKFHRRTFFADNWPDRAHNWLPCNDHPADKASVEFLVTAPDHYQVVANGVLLEEINLPDHLKLSHWMEELVLPSKVMVIGVADFAVRYSSDTNCIEVSSWVFPENRDSGFAQYKIAKRILPFYIKYIGPYPYKKLANVQSKTIYGGMENASNIFYYENSVKTSAALKQDEISREKLFAHEIAHQWFGDEASEQDWQHLWLSEGFATYLTHLYMEQRYGTDSLKREMERDRDDVITFYKKRKTPVVDTSSRKDLLQLLNVNAYQKGSWVLHMLRRKLGNDIFQKGLQTYYTDYKGKNASTNDFMRVMEKVSKQNLQAFFKQWLYTAGQPVLDGKWAYNSREKLLAVTLHQKADFMFQFPLQIAIKGQNQTVIKTINFKSKSLKVNWPLNFKPQYLVLDPEVNLLFEGNLQEEK